MFVTIQSRSSRTLPTEPNTMPTSTSSPPGKTLVVAKNIISKPLYHHVAYQAITK